MEKERPNKSEWIRMNADNPGLQLRAMAELAKRGVTISDKHSPTRSEMLSDRNSVRRVVNEMRDDLKKVAEKPNFGASDQRRIDDGIEMIKALGALIDTIDAELCLDEINSSHSAAPSATNWKGSNGTMKILGKRDSLSNAYTAKDAGFGFGEFVASMVRGTSSPEIRASLSEGTDSAGGYTVPDHLMTQVIDAMRAKTVAIQAGALTVPLDTEKTTIARLESDPVAGWRLELGNVAVSDPTFGAVTFQARSLACLVKVSRELLEDSANIDSALMNAFAGAMAAELDRVAFFGTGTAPEPRGIFNAANVLSVSMGTNGAALTGYAKILDALYELENANSNAPTGMVMAPRTSRVLNGLVDSTGQPLNPPEAVRAVPRLASNIVPVNQAHGTANNASSIICGDFSQLLIGIRTVLRIDVLKETFASTMEYGFLAHLRADIALAKPKSFVAVKGIIP